MSISHVLWLTVILSCTPLHTCLWTCPCWVTVPCAQLFAIVLDSDGPKQSGPKPLILTITQTLDSPLLAKLNFQLCLAARPTCHCTSFTLFPVFVPLAHSCFIYFYLLFSLFVMIFNSFLSFNCWFWFLIGYHV